MRGIPVTGHLGSPRIRRSVAAAVTLAAGLAACGSSGPSTTSSSKGLTMWALNDQTILKQSVDAYLLGFAKLPLEPGQRATVRFHVDSDRLAFTGLNGGRIVEPGEIRLQLGSSSLDTPVRDTIRLVGEERDATVLRQHAVPVSVERE
ncbi:fibronectin type III-like domain-contianing protein [Streptomyces sp. NBC_01478]|uniref:fibronectin type III-like domain-contianing protein n=1 Tax=Streptomyces sp. NBC_01478 TaxID=2903882 RepID=UPI002E336B49|nr:fibronectin type III-like domain-contianing protein [Streptomyces sp. NBC_01478]